MKARKPQSQSYALVLVLAGVFTYIAVDSKFLSLFDKSLPSLSKAKQVQLNTPEQSLIQYADKLNGELGTIEKDLKSEKNKLGDLQKEVKGHEQTLASHKQNLQNIDQEIRNLAKLRNALKAAHTRETGRVPAASKSPHAAPLNISQVAKNVQKDSSGEVAIEPVKYAGKEFIRLRTNIEYSVTNGIYLSAAGIRQTARFAEGAISLGYDSIKLAHHVADTQINERLAVVKRFLEGRYGEHVKISTMDVDGDVELTDGFEIWVAKEEGLND